MSSCVCKISFKSVQVCGGCCKMFRGLTFLGHSVEDEHNSAAMFSCSGRPICFFCYGINDFLHPPVQVQWAATACVYVAWPFVSLSGSLWSKLPRPFMSHDLNSVSWRELVDTVTPGVHWSYAQSGVTSHRRRSRFSKLLQKILGKS